MPNYQFVPSDPLQLAHQLSRARQRGLTDLDLDLHGKPPVPHEEIAALTATAEAYGDAIGAVLYGRATRITRLIEDGLRAYAAEEPKDSAFINALCFDPPRPLLPSAEPLPPSADERLQRKKAPDELLKDVKAKFNIEGFDDYRLAVFARFMTFLNGFVLRAVAEAAARREATALRERAVALSRPRGSQPPPRRVQRGTTVVASLVAIATLLAALFVAMRLPPLPVPLTTAPTISGYAECWPDTTKAVEGVWIEAALGGSGWADWHALPGQPNVAAFSRSLPHGGSYVVHVGCGGDRVHWELPLASVTALLGSGYFFACYDVPIGDSSLGRCQP